jgi:hypothetical protein
MTPSQLPLPPILTLLVLYFSLALFLPIPLILTLCIKLSLVAFFCFLFFLLFAREHAFHLAPERLHAWGFELFFGPEKDFMPGNLIGIIFWVPKGLHAWELDIFFGFQKDFMPGN